MTLRPVRPLDVRGLTVSYAGVAAVTGLDLVVEQGEVVGLAGPNGCGKTTTLRAVMGLVRPDRGEVRVEGLAAGTLEARARVSWVPDEPTGLDELTLGEFLDLVRVLYGAEGGFRARSASLLAAFGLEERRRSALGSLSHGLRRAAAVVAAAALGLPLLVVDEATAALDPEAVVVLREVLRTLAARGTAVLVATQDLHFVERTCDRIALLSAGRLAAGGNVEELCRAYRAASLEGAFLAAIGRGRRAEEVRRALESL